jgi:hypothetical protein
MNVLQMVFFAISLTSNIPPYVAAATQISEFVNGFIYRPAGTVLMTQPQLVLMNVSTNLVNNCNFMLLVELIVVALGLCLRFLDRNSDP